MLLVCCVYFTQANSVSGIKTVGPAMVAHIFILSTWEAGGVQCRPAFHRESPPSQSFLMRSCVTKRIRKKHKEREIKAETEDNM